MTSTGAFVVFLKESSDNEVANNPFCTCGFPENTVPPFKLRAVILYVAAAILLPVLALKETLTGFLLEILRTV